MGFSVLLLVANIWLTGPEYQLALNKNKSPQTAVVNDEHSFWKRPRTKSIVHTVIPILAALGAESMGNDETGTILASYGALVGPSYGLFKEGQKKRAWLGLGIRTAGALYGISNSFESCPDIAGADCDDGKDGDAVLGGAVMLGSALWDIAITPKQPTMDRKMTMKVIPAFGRDQASIQVKMRW